MAKALVIVESPAKAKTINKYLGKQYVVKASLGHIKDLPKRDWQSMSRTVSNRGTKSSKAKEAHRGAEAGPPKKVQEIYLAADPDREGEAICAHLQKNCRTARTVAPRFTG
jgi:DNA topoisomerase-1